MKRSSWTWVAAAVLLAPADGALRMLIGAGIVSVYAALTAREAHNLRLYLPQTFDALAQIATGTDSHEEAARTLGAAQRARRGRAIAPSGSAIATLVHRHILAARGGATRPGGHAT